MDMVDSVAQETDLRRAQLVMLRILRVVDDICCKNDIKYWLDGGTVLGAIRHKGFIPWDDDLDVCMLRGDYRRFIALAPKALPGDLFLQVCLKDLDYYLHWAKIRDKCSAMEEKAYRRARFHKGIGIDIIPCDFFPRANPLTWLEKFLAKAFRYRSKNLHEDMSADERVNFIASKFISLLIPIKVEQRVFTVFKAMFKQSRQRVGYGIGTPFSGSFHYDTIFPLSEAEFEGCLFPVPKDPDRYLATLYGDYWELPPPDSRTPHCEKIMPDHPCDHEKILNPAERPSDCHPRNR
jgi:lipopolysaccharide cholinephosphotransferase